MNNPSLVDRLQRVRLNTRHDLHVTRHVHQGRPGYIVHDPIRFTAHHLDVDDYQVFASLTEEFTLQEIYQSLKDKGVLAEDQEANYYHFVVYLNQLGLLTLPITDGTSLFQRHEQRERAKSRAKFNPMGLLFLRVPLIHPDAFLSRTVRFAAPLFTKNAFVMWMFALVACCVMLVKRWDEFVDPLSSMLDGVSLPLLWCLLISLKLIHEFGHAYACKHFGGHVPEMGAFFMVMTPCAYVDASSSWSFASRLHRIIVSLAGVYFESIVAMAAFAYWCCAEPSAPFRSLAHYTFVLSSVITVGFNINPLMRYDGYYVLADLVNVPNLRAKSTSILFGALKRLFYGSGVIDQTFSRRGRWCILLFGVASAIYRVVVIGGIVMLLALRFPTFGLIAAGGIVFSTGFTLSRKLYSYLAYSPEMESRRVRGFATTLACMGVILLCTCVLPTPRRVRAPGFIEQSDDIVLRARGEGLLIPTETQDGWVGENSIVCRIENDELESRVKQQKALVESLRFAVFHALSEDYALAAVADQQRMQANQRLERLLEEQRELIVRAPADGKLMKSDEIREAGRYISDGDTLGRIAVGKWLLRVAMTEEEFARAEIEVGTKLCVRTAGTGLNELKGRVADISKVASDIVPDVRLTHLAGGPIMVHPETMQARATYFEIGIQLVGDIPNEVLHGMSGAAIVPCRPERVAVDAYRTFLRLFHRVRLES